MNIPEDTMKKLIKMSIDMADKRTNYKLSSEELTSYVISEINNQTYIARNWIRTAMASGLI